jgi:hypothetical protein
MINKHSLSDVMQWVSYCIGWLSKDENNNEDKPDENIIIGNCCLFEHLMEVTGKKYILFHFIEFIIIVIMILNWFQ